MPGWKTADAQVQRTYGKKAYRERNLIELMFGRLRDFRRVATPYNKLARNFLATTLIAAIAIWWLS
jgi:putative transposase